MAIHANSTTAPARPLLPLRGPDGRFTRRAEPRAELPPEPLLAPVDAAESTAPAASVARGLSPETAPESTALRPAYRTVPDTTDAIRRDLEALVGGAVEGKSPATGPADRPSALAARTLHLRRQLAAAVDHGTDLLASLGLPRLVGPGFVPIDLREAGDAIEAAVAALDALDGDADIEDEGEAEPSLGWVTSPAGVVFLGATSDREDDSEENEGTALESAGRGFARCGPDDAEDDDPAEDDGSAERDDGPEPYLSVVEFDGDGDNWGRSGHGTCGRETDVEAVNEGGDGANDPPWWSRPGAWPSRVMVAIPPAEAVAARRKVAATGGREVGT